MQRSKQRGTAIITVLLVLAIITAIATALMVQQRIDIRRTQQIVTSDQNYRYAQGVLYWAVGVIKQDTGQDAVVDPNNKEEWTRSLPTTLIADKRGLIEGQLIRLEQRNNVNALGKGDASKTALTYLAENISELDEKSATQLIGAINDWVQESGGNPPGETTANTIDYAAEYLSYNPPYRVAHTMMVSPSELRLLMGVNPTIYTKLLYKFVALPIQQASSPAYYLLQANVKLDDQTLQVYSLLQRIVDNNGAAKVLVLYESRGTL
ncbi:MAG: type II secretion system minor pseudopilin GspK [Pseudomonadota bacterium]|nr:type II secretion system minor pseudopilin GspK [Pseudomonadota bacterium]